MCIAGLPSPCTLTTNKESISMNNYPSSRVVPYVYKLTHKITKKFYIGVRFANKVPSSDDLGAHYFTSSDIVKPKFHEYECMIVAEFLDKRSAIDFEGQLISENFDNPNILNRWHVTALNHVSYASCLCCRKVFDRGNLTNHWKDKSQLSGFCVPGWVTTRGCCVKCKKEFDVGNLMLHLKQESCISGRELTRRTRGKCAKTIYCSCAKCKRTMDYGNFTKHVCKVK